MATGNWTLIDSETITGYYRGEANAEIKIYTYSLELDDGAGISYLTMTHFPQGEITVTGGSPGSGGSSPETGLALSTAQSMATSFTSDVYTNLDGKLMSVYIDCSSVTDNTGTFTFQHRAPNGGSEWQTLTIDDVFVVNDADVSHHARISLAPCDLRVSFAAAGTIPDGSCNIILTAGG